MDKHSAINGLTRFSIYAIVLVWFEIEERGVLFSSKRVPFTFREVSAMSNTKKWSVVSLVVYLVLLSIAIYLIWGSGTEAKKEAGQALKISAENQSAIKTAQKTADDDRASVKQNKLDAETRSAALDGRMNAYDARFKGIEKSVGEVRDLARNATSTANGVSGIAERAEKSAERAEKKANEALVAWNEAKERLNALQGDLCEVKAQLERKIQEESVARQTADKLTQKAVADARAASLAQSSGLQRTASQARIRAEQAEKKANIAVSFLERQIAARVAVEERLKELEKKSDEAKEEIREAETAVEQCAPRRLLRRW